MFKFITVFLLSFTLSTISYAEPTSFNNAKNYVKEVYKGKEQTFYCGCDYRYVGKTGGRIDLESCGFEIRSKDGNTSDAIIARANRLEYEHVVPASWYGQQLQCWQNGGRKNCQKVSEEFNKMESDIINLVPAIGQPNGDRSNYKFGMITSHIEPQYGKCDFKVDFKNKIAQPKDSVKGEIARIMFYMYDEYGMNMSRQDQQLYLAWNKMYPVSEWELEKNRRFKNLIGRDNPFVSGKKEWTDSRHKISTQPVKIETIKDEIKTEIIEVRGNKNSKIYHLHGCPHYNFSEKNRIIFNSEEEATAAGFRKAGNC